MRLLIGDQMRIVLAKCMQLTINIKTLQALAILVR